MRLTQVKGIIGEMLHGNNIRRYRSGHLSRFSLLTRRSGCRDATYELADYEAAVRSMLA